MVRVVKNNPTVWPEMGAGQDRKQVPEHERVALSRALVSLLDERVGPERKRKWSQASLGIALGGLSQEAIRRAQNPAGIGPAIRDALPGLMGLTIEQVVDRFGGSGELRLDPVALASALLAQRGVPPHIAAEQATREKIAFQERDRPFTAQDLEEAAWHHLQSQGAPNLTPDEPRDPGAKPARKQRK